MNRIPTLDGWRGIAIMLVLLDHAQVALMGGYLHPWTQTGQHGVTLFFVLSGYLITTRLLQGPIDLKRFYVRRFFRLLPVAWTYLGAVWLFSLLCAQPNFSSREIASYIFFFRNYLGQNASIYTGHFWSLSVEEQYYLVWPALLLLAGIRRARWVAAGGALAFAVFRFASWQAYDQQWICFRTEVRADALLIGCLLALLLHAPALRAAALRASRFWALPSLAVFLACFAWFHNLIPFIESLAIAGLIAASTLHPQSLFARPLGLRPVAWLGAVSYSVYVWQQFFFLPRRESVTIVMICLMPVFALASYYWIERPATHFGHRLTSASGPAIPALSAASAGS
jgi:peptidoglycan/LPS O-acetylase OafA/YrhL